MRDRFVPWSRRRSRRALAVVLLTAIGSAAAATDPRRRRASGRRPSSLSRGPVPTPRSYEVTLITGDRRALRRLSGRPAVGHRGRGIRAEATVPSRTFEIREIEGDLYVFPSDLARYVGPKLDRELFNVSELVEQGFDDERDHRSR